jgi:hypothetical protein
MGALISLQMLYSSFTAGNQTSFGALLGDGQAWQGLISSSLYNASSWSFRMNNDNGTLPSDDMSLLGAMELFLYGIIPGTGGLAVNPSNERYQDYQTCFPLSQWSFNYQNSSIRIPVMQGTLTFIFGTQNVTQNFPSNGVYDVQFANDWNSILSITKIADINNTALQPAVLQPIPTSSPSISPTASSNPTPTASDNQTSTKPNPATHNSTGKPGAAMFEIAVTAVVAALSVTVLLVFYVKRKSRRLARSRKQCFSSLNVFSSS